MVVPDILFRLTTRLIILPQKILHLLWYSKLHIFAKVSSLVYMQLGGLLNISNFDLDTSRTTLSFAIFDE